jgi:hypothetical protein
MLNPGEQRRPFFPRHPIWAVSFFILGCIAAQALVPDIRNWIYHGKMEIESPWEFSAAVSLPWIAAFIGSWIGACCANRQRGTVPDEP